MERHNGWRNYETWQAALWLDNEGYLNHMRREGEIKPEAIREALEEMCYVPWGTLLSDVVMSWLSQVDVDEIYNNHKDD
jgi:hypothetical protein